MAAPVIYGPAISTYVRTVRLVCEEKGAHYELVEVDIMQGGNKTPEHLARHPFGRVPAFEHDGFKLYETSAITRYLDAVLPGPSLTPAGWRPTSSSTCGSRGRGAASTCSRCCTGSGWHGKRKALPDHGHLTIPASRETLVARAGPA